MKTKTQWFGGRSGTWTTLHGAWAIVRLPRRRSHVYVVIERAHPERDMPFVTLSAAKRYVDAQTSTPEGESHATR
jgi:hypothetical protein